METGFLQPGVVQTNEDLRRGYANQVQVPAIAMCVISGVNLLMFGIVAPIMLAEAITGTNIVSEPGDQPAELGAAILGLSIALLHLLILFGAIQLLRLRSKGWAMFSSIAMIIPCTGPCCVIGIPLGIWSLTSINKVPKDVWES